MKFLFRKRRRYPIRRDQSGRSLRQQAFELFDGGSRPSQIYKQKLIQASPRTLFRYFEDWKKENNRPSYSILKKAMRRDPGLTEDLLKELSKQMDMPIGEVIALTNQPWGMLQLFGEYLFGNSPEIVEALVADIILLRDNSRLEIRKEHGMISVTTRYRNGQIEEKKLNCKIAR
jgi:hypothetical protein